MRHALGVVLLLVFGSANAAIVIPAAGAEGSLSFGGTPGELIESFEITVVELSSIDVWLDDCCVIGDQFSLSLDGSSLTPTAENYATSGVGGSELFSAFYDDVSLSVGTHIFDVYLSAACCNSGGGSYQFSATTSAVPVPAAVWLFGSALAGLGFMRRRQTA